MKLTLLALSYFQKTAELQHLTRAAEALHISQPSLSHTIKVLETELGVPLFSRSGRNIVLTKYGEILLRHTNRIMQELHSAQKELAEITGIKQPAIARLENGHISPSVDTINRLLAPLGKRLAVVDA